MNTYTCEHLTFDRMKIGLTISFVIGLLAPVWGFAQPPEQPLLSPSEIILDESEYTIFHASDIMLLNDSLLQLLDAEDQLITFSLVNGKAMAVQQLSIDPAPLFERYVNSVFPEYRMAFLGNATEPTFNVSDVVRQPMGSYTLLGGVDGEHTPPGMERGVISYPFLIQMDDRLENIVGVIPGFTTVGDTSFEFLNYRKFLYISGDALLTPPADMYGAELLATYDVHPEDSIYFSYPELMHKTTCFKYPTDFAVNWSRKFFYYDYQEHLQGRLVSYGNTVFNIDKCQKIYEVPPGEMKHISGFYADFTDSLLYLLVLEQVEGELSNQFRLSVVDLKTRKVLREQHLEKEGRQQMKVKLDGRNVLMLEKGDEHVYLRRIKF